MEAQTVYGGDHMPVGVDFAPRLRHCIRRKKIEKTGKVRWLCVAGR